MHQCFDREAVSSLSFSQEYFFIHFFVKEKIKLPRNFEAPSKVRYKTFWGEGLSAHPNTNLTFAKKLSHHIYLAFHQGRVIFLF